MFENLDISYMGAKENFHPTWSFLKQRHTIIDSFIYLFYYMNFNYVSYTMADIYGKKSTIGTGVHIFGT